MSPCPPRRSTPLALALLALLAGLAGCGGSDGDPSDVLDDPPRVEADREPVEPPPAKESLADAERRIAEAGDDCERLFELLPLNTPQEARTPQRCASISRATGGTAVGSEEFGELAAVIDYEAAPGALASLLLVREADGLYHVAVADGAATAPSTESELDRDEADEAIDATFDALAARDCDALLAVRFQGFGPEATLERGPICEALRRDAIALALEQDPSLRPDLIGGNGEYAFYGLSTPRGHYTFVLIRQKPHAQLASDAPAYGLHHRYVTNQASAR